MEGTGSEPQKFHLVLPWLQITHVWVASLLSFQLLWETRARQAQREPAGTFWLLEGWGEAGETGPAKGGWVGQRHALDVRLSEG